MSQNTKLGIGIISVIAIVLLFQFFLVDKYDGSITVCCDNVWQTWKLKKAKRSEYGEDEQYIVSFTNGGNKTDAFELNLIRMDNGEYAIEAEAPNLTVNGTQYSYQHSKFHNYAMGGWSVNFDYSFDRSFFAHHDEIEVDYRSLLLMPVGGIGYHGSDLRIGVLTLTRNNHADLLVLIVGIIILLLIVKMVILTQR